MLDSGCVGTLKALTRIPNCIVAETTNQSLRTARNTTKTELPKNSSF
jgi:hypothetical protein